MKKILRDQPHEESGAELPTHRAALGGSEPVGLRELSLGDVVRFYYEGADRYVYVLSVWEKKLHGLTLRHIDHHTLVTEVIVHTKGNPDPQTFYESYITKPSIAAKNCYRTYDTTKLSRITKLEYKVAQR